MTMQFESDAAVQTELALQPDGGPVRLTLFQRAEAFISCSADYNNDHGDIARVAIQRNPDPTKPIIRSDYNVRASPAL